MPRKPRFIIPNVPVHIVQRGHSRNPVFFEDSDYLAYLDWLKAGALRYKVAIHAYGAAVDQKTFEIYRVGTGYIHNLAEGLTIRKWGDITWHSHPGGSMPSMYDQSTGFSNHHGWVYVNSGSVTVLKGSEPFN